MFVYFFIGVIIYNPSEKFKFYNANDVLITGTRLLEDVHHYTSVRLSLKSHIRKHAALTEIHIDFTIKIMGVEYIIEYYNT